MPISHLLSDCFVASHVTQPIAAKRGTFFSSGDEAINRYLFSLNIGPNTW